MLFPRSGNHFTWRKVTTTVHNIIVGRLWVDNHGDMDIINHRTNDRCHLKYLAYSYFSREAPRKVCLLQSLSSFQFVLFQLCPLPCFSSFKQFFMFVLSHVVFQVSPFKKVWEPLHLALS